MRWGLVAVVGVVGCGRLNFSPIAQDALGDSPFSAPVPISDLNSTGTDDDPSLTGDLLEIFFSSDRSGVERLYSATRASPSAAWSAPALVSELDTADINNARVTPDGLTLVFSSMRAPTAGNVDLWIATRPDRATPWTPRHLDELATASGDFEGWLPASDAATIYFTSSRTNNEADLWTASRPTPTDPFGPATRIAELSVVGYDGSMWVDASERLALFHSARAGLLDIFYATRASAADLWSAPQPLAEFNSSADDSDPWLSPDGRTFVFVSKRDSGNDDLYISTR